MSLLVVGSVALDSVKTPAGQVTNALGGSAVYFSMAARLLTSVQIVGVVGSDFPEEHVDLLRQHGIDVTGLEIAAGKTFRWAGVYEGDMSVAKTLDTQLNVFAEFHPKLPPSAVSVPYLFLANIHPSLQWNVLDQVRSPRLVVLDTMNLWIRNNLEEVKRLLRRVDGIIINDQEVRMLTGETNLIRAGRAVLALGPRMVVLKKGEHGALVFHGDEVVPLPAFPLTNVVDPTGAGDSFAGGFMGYLASRGHRLTTGLLRRAVAHGVITSSFCCEDFSLERLKTVTKGEFGARYEAYRRLLRV